MFTCSALHNNGRVLKEMVIFNQTKKQVLIQRQSAEKDSCRRRIQAYLDRTWNCLRRPQTVCYQLFCVAKYTRPYHERYPNRAYLDQPSYTNRITTMSEAPCTFNSYLSKTNTHLSYLKSDIHYNVISKYLTTLYTIRSKQIEEKE